MFFTFGSVCSGIEAASVAWHPLGWRAAWLAEIEPFPSAVLAHHYPDVPNLGDMTQLPERIVMGEVEAPDLFCGGTPCQAFSVAGLRQSLDDVRGNLSLTFCEIANAIDISRAHDGLQPCIVFWENVPGVLSTRDNAFGCFLAGLAGEGEPLVPAGGKWSNAGAVLGPQRAVAWRVLDAQYFGVAQRRRRVFVVASARDGFDPTAVLFEFDGLRRDSAPSREAREGTTRGVEIGPGGGRFTELNPTLDTRAKDGPIRNQLAGAVLDVAKTICAGGHSNNPLDETLVPVAFHPTQDPISSTDGTTHCMGTGSSQGNATVAVAFQPGNLKRGCGSAPSTEVFPTLAANHGRGQSDQDPHVAVAVSLRGREGGATAELGDEVQNCLRASSGGGDKPHVLAAMQVRRLTPVECERLQGFPDGYTQIPWRNKPADECPDGPRYKALGNSWAVPVVRWIGQRIAAQVFGDLA